MAAGFLRPSANFFSEFIAARLLHRNTAGMFGLYVVMIFPRAPEVKSKLPDRSWRVPFALVKSACDTSAARRIRAMRGMRRGCGPHFPRALVFKRYRLPGRNLRKICRVPLIGIGNNGLQWFYGSRSFHAAWVFARRRGRPAFYV